LRLLPHCGIIGEETLESLILIEAAAGLILLAAFAYAVARVLSLRRLGAQFYYRPRREPVPLATILKDVFPDAQLSPKEREQLHRFGIDGGGPHWTEWIHRQNLSRLSIISKSGESGWSGAMTLHKLHETDGHITESISYLVRRRLEAFADLRKPPHGRTNAGDERTNADMHDRLFAEHILADSLKGRAHSVTFAESPDRGIHQAVVDGRTFELGGALQFDFQNHFEEYPGTSILTPGDFFRAEEGLFTIDHAPGSYKLSILGGGGLDAAFGTNKALAGNVAVAAPHIPVLAAAGDVDFQNPFLTLGLSTMREIRLLKKKHTNLLTSVKNIGLDAAGTGIGSFAGAKAGATIGTAVAPGMGSVVGAIIGGISGAFAGRSISNRIKFSRAETARSHYEKKILEFEQRVREVTREAMDALETSLERERSVLATMGLKRVRELEALTTRLESKRRSAYMLPRESMRDFFSRCETDIREEAKEIDEALRGISFRERVLWPGEAAARLFVQRKYVMGHLAELVTARSALLDPACSLGDVERTEVCLELFAAFGSHEEDIRKHITRYKTTALENLRTLIDWPPVQLRELARTRAASLRRISGKAEILRRTTGVALKRDVTKAKRAQTLFAKELRKLGLVR
jgi:hypothetical protein